MPLNDKEVAKHKNWITLAEAKHSERVVKVADEFLKYLDQDGFKAQTDDNNQSVFNYYFANLRRLIPELLPRTLKLKVKPKDGRETLVIDGQQFDNKKASMILNAKINETMLNKRTIYQIKQAIYDLLVANMACVMVGQKTTIEEQDVIPEGTENLLKEKASNGELIVGEEAIPETEMDGESQLIITKESYKNIMVDPDSTDFFFTDKKYLIRIVRLTASEAKDKYGSKAEGSEGVEYIGTDKRNKEAERKVFYEVYDYTGDKIKRTTYLGKGAKFIDTAEFDHDPLKLCKLNYLPGETYPASDMKYYKAQVDESNFYGTTAMNSISRNSARKVLVDADALTADDQSKLTSDKDMEIVTVDTKGRGLQSSIFIFESGRPPIDQWNAKDRIAGEIGIISQVNSQRMGVTSDTPATNASIADQSFRSGVEERAMIIKDFILDIIQGIIETLKEVSVEGERVYVELPNGDKEELQWSSSDIQYAEVDVDLDLQASLPDDVKIKRAMEFAQWAMQPQIQQGLMMKGKTFDILELVKEVGQYMLPTTSFDRVVVDMNLPDPARENLMMMAGNPVQLHPQEDMAKHLQEHSFLLKHPLFEGLPLQIKEMIMKHIEDTQMALQEKQTLMQQQQIGTGKIGNIQAGARNVA